MVRFTALPKKSGQIRGNDVNARFAQFVLDSDQRRLVGDDGEVHLTPKAFDLLVLLIEESPRVVRKTELHECLWPGTFVSDATLVGLVKELRRALADRDSKSPVIRTAHRVGYAFGGQLQSASSRGPAVSRWVVVGSRRVPLTEGDNLIGRDPSSTICLDATGVSRRHARIVIGERAALLEDLGSKNGTTLGDQVLTGQAALHDGDRIQVGPIMLVFHASASGLSTETVSGYLPPRRRPRNP
jgi:DNA-binding winged helix-turn-helix (wHTH) protein